ncbi:MAG TPA: branched-chain amino acid ABC transporter permease [Tessaracoccus flavescens]|uniref:Branched-chain amino acid ABC transporter permease n=1 Tax=Tessaracoccus flavescens TaxID=399497 RepID=A0A1Q2CWQ5_9ACTN|nr:branched-chain amino acid ABC transporter permease [Tessaracoccus flavescens]AQP50553.1 branched-chain amino acid ABC transporter permease [Tessaracoccus flavescens]HJE51734.1 branched-chain amino acid ABC transporter permease [Tessaracoccus flavescens]
MTEFLQQLINSLSLGSIYALIALGYTMVYGIIKLINFAHGEVYMVGAYVGYFSMSVLKLGFFESLVLAMLICTVLGVLIERIAYRPLRNSTRIAALITAIGVSLLIQYTMMFFVGADPRAYPAMPDFMNGSINLGGVVIKNQQILIIGVSVLLMILLQFVVKKTKMGKAMRAVSQDPDAARLMGISVDRTISFTFAIGSALAGAAGVLVGVYYNSINPLMGIIPGLKAFVAAVFGGIGIIPGALIGGYVIGGSETLVSSLGFSLFKDGVVFAILIAILIIKPTGLLGKNRKEKV